MSVEDKKTLKEYLKKVIVKIIKAENLNLIKNA